MKKRLGRDKLRANLIERLNDIINNENTTEEMRIEAQKKDNAYWRFIRERIKNRRAY